MPTPVNHLVMAQELLVSGELTPAAQRFVEIRRGPFLLGQTAPDVQTVSHQARHETHFYTLPPQDGTWGYIDLLIVHPELARARRLDPDHAAFMAGYLSHLLVDETWWREIFNPFFGPGAEWGSWRERIFLHNVLRTWLDRKDQTRLDRSAAAALAATRPQQWLPFTRDEELRAWRDSLVEQLRPGRHIRTAEIFALRMQIPPETIESAVQSTRLMECIFSRVSAARLEAYRAGALSCSATLINKYLEGIE